MIGDHGRARARRPSAGGRPCRRRGRPTPGFPGLLHHGAPRLGAQDLVEERADEVRDGGRRRSTTPSIAQTATTAARRCGLKRAARRRKSFTRPSRIPESGEEGFGGAAARAGRAEVRGAFREPLARRRRERGVVEELLRLGRDVLRASRPPGAAPARCAAPSRRPRRCSPSRRARPSRSAGRSRTSRGGPCRRRPSARVARRPSTVAVPEATRRTSEAARRARCSPETTRQRASAGPASSSSSASEIESARTSTTSRSGTFLRRISTASRKTGRMRLHFALPRARHEDDAAHAGRRRRRGTRELRGRGVHERVAHPRDVRPEAARVVPALLEAEEDEHRAADPRDRLRAPPAPGPHLRRDVEHDGHAGLREALREREVEVGRVDEDRGVGPLAAPPRRRARWMRRRAKRIFENASTSPMIARSFWCARRRAPAAFMPSPPTPKTSRDGTRGAQGREERGRVLVARDLSGDEEEFHGVTAAPRTGATPRRRSRPRARRTSSGRTAPRARGSSFQSRARNAENRPASQARRRK